MYTLNAAADVAGDKVNYVLEFPYPPSFPELVARCENVFTRAAGAEFVVFTIQRFHDDPVEGARWVSVTGVGDIFKDCQLYVFDEHSWHHNIQKPIPSPVYPPCPTSNDLPAPPVLTATAAVTNPLPQPRHGHVHLGMLQGAAAIPTVPVQALPRGQSHSIQRQFAPVPHDVPVGGIGAGVGVGFIGGGVLAPPSHAALTSPLDTPASQAPPALPRTSLSVASAAAYPRPSVAPQPAYPSAPMPSPSPMPLPTASVHAHAILPPQASMAPSTPAMDPPAPHPLAGGHPLPDPAPMPRLPLDDTPAPPLFAPLSVHALAPPAAPLSDPITDAVAAAKMAFTAHPHVPHTEKAAYTYKNLVNRYSAVLRQDDLVSACATLAVPLSAQKVVGVFERCDRDGDGVLSVDEWNGLCQTHPALLESLYFRIRDGEDAAAIQARLGEVEVQLRVFHAKEQSTGVAAQTAAAAVSANELKLTQQDARVAEKTAKLRQLQDTLGSYEEMVRGKEAELKARAEEQRHHAERLVHREEEATGARDATLRAQALADDRRNVLVHAQQSVALREEELGARREHTGKQKDQHRVLMQSRSEVLASVMREKQELPDVTRDVAQCTAAYEAADVAATALEASEGDAGRRAREETQSVSGAELQRTAEADAYTAAVRRQAELDQQVVLCGGEVANAQKEVTRLQEEHAAYTHRRRLVETQERPLIEEELQLRHQRELLVQRHHETREQCDALRSPVSTVATATTSTANVSGADLRQSVMHSPPAPP